MNLIQKGGDGHLPSKGGGGHLLSKEGGGWPSPPF